MIRIPTALVCSVLLCQAAEDPGFERNMKAYPPAEKGMTRHLVKLPVEDKEDNLKVEIVVGKTVKTDGVNRHFLGGSIEEETIKGWGFPRYLVRDVGPMAGTLMGVPAGTPMVDTFVSLRGNPYLVRYNSKLPLVIYVPEGCEVRYRIWRADPEAKPADKG